MSGWRQREARDLLLLLGGLVLVPVAWAAVMGWRPDLLLMAHDGKESLFTTLRDLLEQGGAWSSNVYSLSMLGGVPVHDVMGTPPIYRLAGLLGLSVVGTLNLSAMFVQLLVGFCTARTAVDLTRHWSGGGEPGKAETLAVLLTGAFAPALAWRLGYGHLMLVFGVLAFAPGAALMAAALEGTFSVTLLAVTVVAMTHAFSTAGHQLVVYGAIFGLPFFAAMAWRARSLPRVTVPLIAVAAALAFAAPRWSGMVAHALSTDASRGLGGPSVIYSYATSTAQDWMACFTWGNELLPSGRGLQLWHEVNYPVGPLALLLLLVPARRFRAPLAALGLGIAAGLAFSMDVPGVAPALTALCPPLAGFRCPQRALLPFVLLLPAVALAALAARGIRGAEAPSCDRSQGGSLARGAAAGLAAGALVLTLDPMPREILLWIVTAAATLRAGRLCPSHRLAFVILVTAGALGAFRERLLPFPTREDVVVTPERSGRLLREAVAGLDSDLERVRMDFQLTVFQVSSGPAMRLSTLEGYWNPTRRFLDLTAAVLDQPTDHMVNLLTFEVGEPHFQILRQLYNVRWNVFRRAGFTQVAALGDTAGRAWLSEGVRALPGMREVGRHLREAGAEAWRRAHEVVLLAGDDPFTAPALAALLSPGGARAPHAAAVRSVKSRPGHATIEIELDVPATLPLTIATNFTERLRAWAVVGETREPLLTFPAYGALLGVVVPAGTTRVLVEPEPYGLPWSHVMEGTGLLLLLLTIALARRASRTGIPS